jgi:hypothetical protein
MKSEVLIFTLLGIDLLGSLDQATLGDLMMLQVT